MTIVIKNNISGTEKKKRSSVKGLTSYERLIRSPTP